MKEDCEHDPETLHRVSVVAIIRGIRGREVSIVRRPAFPEARMLNGTDIDRCAGGASGGGLPARGRGLLRPLPQRLLGVHRDRPGRGQQ